MHAARGRCRGENSETDSSETDSSIERLESWSHYDIHTLNDGGVCRGGDQFLPGDFLRVNFFLPGDFLRADSRRLAAVVAAPWNG